MKGTRHELFVEPPRSFGPSSLASLNTVSSSTRSAPAHSHGAIPPSVITRCRLGLPILLRGVVCSSCQPLLRARFNARRQAAYAAKISPADHLGVYDGVLAGRFVNTPAQRLNTRLIMRAASTLPASAKHNETFLLPHITGASLVRIDFRPGSPRTVVRNMEFLRLPTAPTSILSNAGCRRPSRVIECQIHPL